MNYIYVYICMLELGPNYQIYCEKGDITNDRNTDR